jgi:uncharacterized protein YbbK (DUF523 family)/GNAT superfamily N-acetyltransferase
MELVSACLVGVACRYNAACRTDPELVRRFAEGGLLPVCPELAGGLGLPRPPSEIRGGGGAEVLEGRARVIDREGRDSTEAFVAGAEATLALARAAGATEAFLAANSPSCGVGEVYDGSFSGRKVLGDGVAAALLARNGVRITRVEGVPAAAGPIVRRARLGDCGALARLAGQLGYPCEEGDVRRRIQKYFARDDMAVIVAELGGEVVGWTSVEATPYFYLETCAELSGFVVDEGCRDRGIGRLIMAEAEAWAASRGLKLIRLRTNVVREGAHRFYERLGFERTKTSHTYSKRLD